MAVFTKKPPKRPGDLVDAQGRVTGSFDTYVAETCACGRQALYVRDCTPLCWLHSGFAESLPWREIPTPMPADLSILDDPAGCGVCAGLGIAPTGSVCVCVTRREA